MIVVIISLYLMKIFENVKFDGKVYDSTRKKMAKDYVQILEDSGLVVSKELTGFICEN